MQENDLIATISLAVTCFIFMVLAIAMDKVIVAEHAALRSASNMSGVYGKVNPILTSYSTVFWACFIIFFIGTILMYLIGAHREDPDTEQFSDQQQFGGGFFNQ